MAFLIVALSVILLALFVFNPHPSFVTCSQYLDSQSTNTRPDYNSIIVDLESNVDDHPSLDPHNHDISKKKIETLHIAGFFPMTGTGGWIGGSGCLPAAKMALHDVNAREDLLPGYSLELTYQDSQCNPGKAAKYMYDMIYEPPKKVILVCGCSTVCSIVAESANMWNLIVVGYGASSPALSDRTRFPTFFRTHPSAIIHNPTRLMLFKKFGWSRVAIILETEEVFMETARDLEQRCRKANIQLLTRVSFVGNGQPTDAMDNLKRADPRIIVGMFYKQQARRVMCEAYKRGLYGEKYVWFLIGWYEDNWWTDVKGLSCTLEEMKKAVEGHLTTEALVRNQDDRTTLSGYTSKEWLKRFDQELARIETIGKSLVSSQLPQSRQPLNKTQNNPKPTTLERPEGYQEAPLAYDAIWAIALALNSTINNLDSQNINIRSYNYSGTSHIKNVFLSELKKTHFLGISGEVAFSAIGDRIAKTQIEQMIDGNYTLIGYFDGSKEQSELEFKNKIRWPRGGPPKDRTKIQEVVQYLSLPYMLTIFLISLVGIIISASLIYFNWSHRNDSLIRMSHPPSNNIMLLGCIICQTSVILLGLDGRFIPSNQFYLICDLRAWFLNIGFSLFFGSMFWKVWQSYLLSTRNIPPLGKTANQQVFMTVGFFCLIDVIILTMWKLYEPMDRTTVKIKEQSGTELDLGDDVIVELKIEYCQANFSWYYLIFCYKGLLLVFGLFLAYETRGVKLRQLNDSKLVGMCIYNVAILCFITGPVSLVNLMRQQANYHYLFVSITIIFCCSLSKILIFIPKVAEYLRRRKKKALGSGSCEPSGSGNHGTNSVLDEHSSRDDEEQLNRLEKENRELMEKIRERDSQMKAMIARIEEARDWANKSLCETNGQSLGFDPRQNQVSLRSRKGI